MNRNEKQGAEITISFAQIFTIIKRNILPILLVTVIFATAAFAVTRFYVKQQYKASALIFVRAKPESTGNASSSEMNAANQLVETYSIILETDDVLNEVLSNIGNKYSVSLSELKNNLTEEKINETDVFRISYVDYDPQRAVDIVTAVADIAPQKIVEITEAGAAKVVNPPTEASPVSKKVLLKTAGFAFLGFLLSGAVFVLIAVLDTRIRSDEDLSDAYDYTVLGIVPTIVSDASVIERKNADDKQKK